MALVGYGGGILAMSGSVGSQVHSHNRFGAYVRARTIPVNPATDRQNAVRVAVQFLCDVWKTTLTQNQRDAWEVYGAAIVRTNALGAQIKLTGFNHFIRSNVPRVQNGLVRIADGPVILTLPPGDPTFTCTVDEAGQEISVVFDDTMAWCTAAFGAMYVSMSIPKSEGTNFIGGPFRMADVLEGADPAGIASPQVMPVPFPVAEGQVVKCLARIGENDSRLSDHFLHQVSVVA